MADVKCCHCGDPIQPTKDVYPAAPPDLHPWVHTETGVPDCRPTRATPRIEIVITGGPPRERIVYVPVYRGGRGGMRRG